MGKTVLVLKLAVMEDLGVEVQLRAFLTLALGGEWSPIRLWPLYSQGKSPLYPLNRCGGYQGQNDIAKRNIPP
jgi:hypothetical protein